MANGHTLLKSILAHREKDKFALAKRMHEKGLFKPGEYEYVLKGLRYAPSPGAGFGVAGLAAAGPRSPLVPEEQKMRAGNALDIEQAYGLPTKSVGLRTPPAPPTNPLAEKLARMDPNKMITLGSTGSWQKESAAMSPEAGLAAAKAIYGSGKRQEAELGRKAGYQLQQVATIKALRTQAETYLGKTKEEEKATRIQLRKASENYHRLVTRMNEAKIDPDRFWDRMPTSKKALGAIASFLGGFAEGFSQGKVKNRVIGILERAIDRDVMAQKANLQKILASTQLAGADRDRLMGQAERLADRARSLMKDVLAYQAHQGAMMEKHSDTKVAMHGIAAAVASSIVPLEKAITPRITSGGTTQRGPQGFMMAKLAKAAGATQRQLKPGEIDKLVEDRQFIAQVGDLAGRIKALKARGGSLTPLDEWRAIFGNEAGEIMPRIEAMARMIGRHAGVDKGNLAEKEGLIMKYAKTGKGWDKIKVALRSFVRDYNIAVKMYKMKIRSYGEANIGVPPTLAQPFTGIGGGLRMGPVKR